MEEKERQREEIELLRDRKPEPIYDENPLIIRPGGKKMKAPKVSVAIDATPATRTESILNQIPIELIKDLETIEDDSHYDSEFIDDSMVPQVVVIEHHHSRSDPLPMDKVLKNIKQNYSTTRIGESDSGSASSLYAKINPKLKSRLQKFNNSEKTEEEIISNDTPDGCEYSKPIDEGIYGRVPKMSTFGVNKNDDINVTCREPIIERDNITPEEALKTIKRRNYPKVLPDFEKRHSLPAPNSLFMPKQLGNSLKDHRQGPHPSCSTMYPPLPPPRMFGTSKSLDLPEEDESVTTNLHVGPLLKRQDSVVKNQTDKSIIDSMERVAMDAQEVLLNHRDEYEIAPNPKCPVHGSPFLFPTDTNQGTSRSVDNLDRNIGNPNWYKEPQESEIITKDLPNMSLPNVSIGNPNWYKTMRKQTDDHLPFEQYGNPDDHAIYESIQKEPKIIITPRIVNTPDINPPTGTQKQPKIIIKPTTNNPRNRERNIPKVSAIPSPEVQNFVIQNTELDTKGAEQNMKQEKPPIKKKPIITRIPSFSKQIAEQTCTSNEKITDVIHPEKIKIVQRVNVVDDKSSLSTSKNEIVTFKSADSSAYSLNTNTNTIKKKPSDKN